MDYVYFGGFELLIARKTVRSLVVWRSNKAQYPKLDLYLCQMECLLRPAMCSSSSYRRNRFEKACSRIFSMQDRVNSWDQTLYHQIESDVKW